MVMDRTQEHSASTSRTSSGDDVFTQIIGDIETIVSVLDSVVDAPKERHALKSQLSGFKSQITVLESQVRRKQRACHDSDSHPASLDISLTSLQRNVDLVARSLGIDPVWNNSSSLDDTHKQEAEEAACPKKISSVSLHCWSFKQKAKKLFHVSAGCKTLRAFSLRLAFPLGDTFGVLCDLHGFSRWAPCVLNALSWMFAFVKVEGRCEIYDEGLCWRSG